MLAFLMDAIPTPRTEAFYQKLYDPSVPAAMIEYASGAEREQMAQLERELHIAKQALEKIVQERFYPMSKRLTTAEGLAENALQEIKNLSK